MSIHLGGGKIWRDLPTLTLNVYIFGPILFNRLKHHTAHRVQLGNSPGLSAPVYDNIINN